MDRNDCARALSWGRTVALATLSLAFAASAAAAEPDKKVGKLLDKSKVRYEVDADGDYKVTYELENGRTQLAFVRSTTSRDPTASAVASTTILASRTPAASRTGSAAASP